MASSSAVVSDQVATTTLVGAAFAVPTFDPALPKGGDVYTTNVNQQFVGNEFQYTWVLMCGWLCLIIVPGIGLFYSGLSRRKSGLSMLFLSYAVTSVVTFQWIFWGYSLAFSRTAGPFIGNLDNFGMKGVTIAPSVGSAVLPDIVYAYFQLVFAACTAMIVVGGSAERGKLWPILIFTFMWVTLVYCPIVCWVWNPSGWLYSKLTALDFAGGGPVHQASGWSGLAFAFVLGKRNHAHTGGSPVKKSHNVSLVFLGTAFIWFGWQGFNGGSALNATMRAMFASFNTIVAASTGLLGWVLIDLIRHKGRFSVVGACEGVIAGLVGITPAAGYVSIWPAAVIGFLTAVVCALSEKVNVLLRIDDGLEVFKLHAIGGMVGSFLTGCFADSQISLLDGITNAPGPMNGNGIQVARQLAEIAAIGSYSFTMTCAILLVLKYIPYVGLRVTDEAERDGLDADQFFDEQIGEWEMFEPHTLAKSGGAPEFVHGHSPPRSEMETEEVQTKA